MTPLRIVSLRNTLVALALVAVLAAVVFAAGAPAANTAQAKVAFVTSQKSGDHGVNDDLLNWFNKAKKDFNLDTTYIEDTDPSTFESTLTNLVNAGNKIIISAWPGFQAPLAAVAKRYPNVRFIHIYGVADTPTIPNVVRVAFRYTDALYLAGMLAAGVSPKTTIGYQEGAANPLYYPDANAYIAGAKRVNPKIKVLSVISGSGFVDASKSHDAAAALFAKRAGVVAMSDESTGIIKAAKEYNALCFAAHGQMVLDPKHVVGAMEIHFGRALYNQLKSALQPNWTGGYQLTGLKTGTTGISISPYFLKEGPRAVVKKIRAVLPKINRVIKQVEKGTFAIKLNTSKPK